MPADFYGEGYETGNASAIVSSKAILAVGRGVRLAELCGKRIEEIRKASDQFYVRRSQSWVHGFFDGWMDRAEKIIQEAS